MTHRLNNNSFKEEQIINDNKNKINIGNNDYVRNNLSKSITDEELDYLIENESTIEDNIMILQILMDRIFPIDVITESMILD